MSIFDPRNRLPGELFKIPPLPLFDFGDAAEALAVATAPRTSHDHQLFLQRLSSDELRENKSS
jgi:hypothetical protein